jgi:hypothetical protein
MAIWKKTWVSYLPFGKLDKGGNKILTISPLLNDEAFIYYQIFYLYILIALIFCICVMGYIGIFVYYVLLIIYNKLCIGCGAYIYALFFRKCIEKKIKPV